MRPSAFHLQALTHPIAFATALLGWIVVLAPAPQRHDTDVPTSIDPVPTIGLPPIAKPPDEAAPSRGSDVVPEDYPLRTATVRAWRANDRVEVPDANGGTIDLRVERDASVAGRRHLTLTHDGLVSTFTQSGDRYFGTLATADGVYALDGDEHAGRLTRHAALDQRMNSHATDYRTRRAP